MYKQNCYILFVHSVHRQNELTAIVVLVILSNKCINILSSSAVEKRMESSKLTATLHPLIALTV